MGGRNLDARTAFYYGYTVNTPAMVAKIPGKGSQYALSFADDAGKPFDGRKSYRLNVPANVPAKDFWSVVLYDQQTRSELQTGQPFPSKNNKRDKMIVNADGSVDIYFGPEAPEGKEANWIQSVAGKGWFAIFRLYGPLEPWFDKTWRPGEIEEVKSQSSPLARGGATAIVLPSSVPAWCGTEKGNAVRGLTPIPRLPPQL